MKTAYEVLKKLEVGYYLFIPFFKQVKQANQYPADPEKIKTQVKAFANDAVRDIMPKIVVRKIQTN